MVSKDYLKSFVALLDNASTDELQARKHLLQDALRDQSLSRDMVADSRFLLRRIQEEQMARNEIKSGQRFHQEAVSG